MREVAAFAAYLPHDSACAKAVNPLYQHTNELEMLRSIEYSLRWLSWTKTKAAQYGRDMPEQHYFPWETMPDSGGWRGDTMTVDEADEFLGWTDLKGA